MADPHVRRGFDWEHLQQLAKQTPFFKSQKERECPACGAFAIRSYMHFSDEERTRVISYSWCANCWRSAGSVGAGPGVPFTDPLEGMTRQERIQIAESGGQIEFFNDLWDKGVLPQQFG